MNTNKHNELVQRINKAIHDFANCDAIKELQKTVLQFTKAMADVNFNNLNKVNRAFARCNISDEKEIQPSFITPRQVRYFLEEQFSLCGCTEFDEVAITLKNFLAWADRPAMDRVSNDKFCPNVGMFYLMADLLDGAGLVEHGTSSRTLWLTPLGKELKDALHTFTPDQIEEAEGN